MKPRDPAAERPRSPAHTEPAAGRLNHDRAYQGNPLRATKTRVCVRCIASFCMYVDCERLATGLQRRAGRAPGLRRDWGYLRRVYSCDVHLCALSVFSLHPGNLDICVSMWRQVPAWNNCVPYLATLRCVCVWRCRIVRASGPTSGQYARLRAPYPNLAVHRHPCGMDAAHSETPWQDAPSIVVSLAGTTLPGFMQR